MLDRLAKRRPYILAAATLLTSGFGVAHAEPARRPPEAPVMAMGAAAIPPAGFLDLCERSPRSCPSTEGEHIDLVAMRAAAMRNYWANAFASQRPGPAAGVERRVDWSRIFSDAQRGRVARAELDTQVAVTAAQSAVEIDPRDGAEPAVATGSPTGAVDIGLAAAAGDAATTAVETDASAMVASAASAADEFITPAALVAEPKVAVADLSTNPTFSLDRAGWKLVNGVNRRINRSVRQTADSRLYGVEDFWALPTAGRGDCEDFVLAKREALIDAGVPEEALSIAIVETHWGESHAVLLLASDRGEYVLDSLSPWVSRWDRVDYTWKSRQRAGRPFDWVLAAI